MPSDGAASYMILSRNNEIIVPLVWGVGKLSKRPCSSEKNHKPMMVANYRRRPSTQRPIAST